MFVKVTVWEKSLFGNSQIGNGMALTGHRSKYFCHGFLTRHNMARVSAPSGQSDPASSYFPYLLLL